MTFREKIENEVASIKYQWENYRSIEDVILDTSPKFTRNLDFTAKNFNAHIICGNGEHISVQASRDHYCNPHSDRGPYSLLEVGFPSIRPRPEMAALAEDPEHLRETVYGWVPAQMILRFISDNGGQPNRFWSTVLMSINLLRIVGDSVRFEIEKFINYKV